MYYNNNNHFSTKKNLSETIKTNKQKNRFSLKFPPSKVELRRKGTRKLLFINICIINKSGELSQITSRRKCLLSCSWNGFDFFICHRNVASGVNFSKIFRFRIFWNHSKNLKCLLSCNTLFQIIFFFFLIRISLGIFWEKKKELD